MKMQPVLLVPYYKDYIWGGTKLKSLYNKKSNLPKIAESWELSCHPDGLSKVDSFFNPQSLWSTLEKNGLRENLGTAWNGEGFPILVKLIDAEKNLSVQVHPDNEYARLHENDNGKTEFWYVLDCEPDAFIYYGFSKPVTPEEIHERIENATLREVLNKVPIKKGDSFLIKAGTVHALSAGSMIVEIQQSSNVTYRLWDYNRMDENGNFRELHIDKALEVADLNPSKTHISPGHIIKSEYFTVDRFFDNSTFFVEESSFCHLLCLNGEGTFCWEGGFLPVKKGSSIFIPAGIGKCYMKGNSSGLLITM